MSGEVIVFYKSMAELDSDWLQLVADTQAEHAKICRQDDVLKAVIEGDSDVLAKANSAEIALAKSQAASLEPFLGNPSIFTLDRLEKLAKKISKKFAEHNRLRVRSKRFLRTFGAN